MLQTHQRRVLPLHGFLFGSHRIILVLSLLLVLDFFHAFAVYPEHELLSSDTGLVMKGPIRAKRQQRLDRPVPFPLKGDVEGGVPEVLVHPLCPRIASVVVFHLIESSRSVYQWTMLLCTCLFFWVARVQMEKTRALPLTDRRVDSPPYTK